MRHFLYKLSVTAAAVLLAGCFQANPVAGPESDRPEPTAHLRGYGEVTAQLTPTRCVFTCADVQHADILMGKLLADFCWDAAPAAKAGTEVVSADGARRIVVHELPPRGVLVLGRLGNKVVAIDAATPAAAAAAGAKDEILGDPQCAFKPRQDYPVYLDCLDLRAVKFYTHAFMSVHGEGAASHWPFLEKIGFKGISYNLGGGMYSEKSPAPGIMNFVNTDFEVKEAERHGGLIVPSFSVGGGIPIWDANRFADSLMQMSPTALEADLCLMESYGMSRAAREASGLWSLRETLRRYQVSPAVGGWQIYDGPAGIEIGANYQEATDFSPAGLQDFRYYLRKIKGFDLKTVGQRYRNNPAAFKSWADVMPPDEAAEFGNLDETCLHFRRGQWQAAGTAVEPPAADNANWRDIKFPEELQTVPATHTFYQIRFDAKTWLAQNPGQEIYLVCGRITAWEPEMTKVWLNHQPLNERMISKPEAPGDSFALKVTGLVQPGANELTLLVPKGKIYSPYFLTIHLPERYPTSDRRLNARHIDLLDWQWYRLGTRHEDLFALARSIDPDRPMTMASGGAWEAADAMADIAVRHSVTLQNTGREAFYQPWWGRLARVAGCYASCEPSGTTPVDASKPQSVNRMLGQILMDGDSSLIFYWSLEDYLRAERDTGWFTKNQRVVALVGKTLPLPPDVVLLRSTLPFRYGPARKTPEPLVWDIGRGEINNAHYSWGYASERELQNGLPVGTRFLLDTGSVIMDQSTVAAVEKFVRAGGTFVALHNTGRHDPVDANTWPVSRLTGCKVLPGMPAGKIKFGSNLPILKEWEGREFAGAGAAIDWKANDHALNASVRLQPRDDQVQVLAQWSDGAAAVTCRTLGQGRVITLASTFWRDALDKEGVWVCNNTRMLKSLLAGFGIAHHSEASQDAIWLNDVTTKNGLENWLIAFNTARTPLASDLKFKADAKPREVR
ncbi:MAG: hypothetical protein WCI73_05325, partial [Phycisphaerae bacterium]